MKRQPTEWEKILANYMTNKGLISYIYIYIYIHTHTYNKQTPYQKNQTTQIKNGLKNWINIFPKRKRR